MYISHLVKTRDLYPGLLQLPSCFSFFSDFSSPVLYSPLLFSHLFPPLHLVLVYIGGSAATPSHIQKGPSVAIPSVQVTQLSHLQVAPTLYTVQVVDSSLSIDFQ
jgi:hypothetical protein